MALNTEEQRQLDRIAGMLREDDPLLARALTADDAISFDRGWLRNWPHPIIIVLLLTPIASLVVIAARDAPLMTALVGCLLAFLVTASVRFVRGRRSASP
jgi:hypothetical protein